MNHDRYYDYEEMTTRLNRLAEVHSALAKLYSIGQSFVGREVWVMEITNPQTGSAETKPAYYLDAQIHAEEHATSSVALYTIWYLLENYGKDVEVTRLLDQQVFYIIPRINPDGAELSLKEPYNRWCGNGRYRPDEIRQTGLIEEDINEDGFILRMRVKDSKGEWKKSSLDPRLMVQREPSEAGGDYYRLYPEGLIKNFDGVNVSIEKPRDGNMNRNFPTNWVSDTLEYGAGELPLSEPEAKALARFILDHPNIAGMCCYHTHGGVILRPSMTRYDKDMSPRDLTLYKELGKVGTALTGYPTISIYEEFTPDKSQARRGGLMDWTYEQMGIISFAPEVWDIETEAGVEKEAFYNLYPRTEEIELKVLNWVTENVGDMGFKDWQTFEHPQLGAVDIGGMVDIWTYRNPPTHLLQDLCHKNMLFNLRHAAAAPRIRLDEVRVEALGSDLFKVRAVVTNHGYLPSNLSDVAIENKMAQGIKVRLELTGAELVMNPAEVDVGHLAGRNERKYPWSPWGQQWSAVSKPVEWLVRASDVKKASVVVKAISQKGGTHVLGVKLGDNYKGRD
jgi:Zinc carboxypeptidase